MTTKQHRILTGAILSTAALALLTSNRADAQANPPAAAAHTAPNAPAAPEIDDAAKALFTQIAAAHFALSSFSANVDLTFVSGGKTVTAKAQIAYARPSRVAIRIVSGSTVLDVISDGKDIYTVDGDTTKYGKTAALPGIDNITGAINGSQASVVGVVPALITKPGAEQVALASANKLSRQPDETIDGVPVDVIQFSGASPEGVTITAVIAAGKADHLIRRASLTHGDGESVTEVYTGVKANPILSQSLFVFTPKPGMKQIAPPAPQLNYDSRLKVGAVPIPFSGTDTHGTLRSLETYKGKVVLLDFWATWCPPCRAAMPAVVAAYNKYHAKGFNIIGVSLDQPNQKAQLAAFTHQHDMPWPQIYDGKWWKTALGQKYGVMAIPFSVLVGKDGKIAAVDPDPTQLDAAIKAALAR